MCGYQCKFLVEGVVAVGYPCMFLLYGTVLAVRMLFEVIELVGLETGREQVRYLSLIHI